MAISGRMGSIRFTTSEGRPQSVRHFAGIDHAFRTGCVEIRVTRHGNGLFVEYEVPGGVLMVPTTGKRKQPAPFVVRDVAGFGLEG